MSGDPLHSRLCDEYGCEVPVCGFAHTKDVIVAVTNAGGIGVLGATGLTEDELRSDIRWIKERVGDKPWGVDLLVPASVAEAPNLEELERLIPQEHRDFVAGIKRDNSIPDAKERENKPFFQPLEKARNQLEVIFDEGVPIFASGLGSPAFIIDRAHEAGMKVWGLVGLPRQAQRQVDAGVDVIIAQGYDSGGHSGSVGTFTLVPEVVRIAEGSDSMVLAAGGVSGGRHLAGGAGDGRRGGVDRHRLAGHERVRDRHVPQAAAGGGARGGSAPVARHVRQAGPTAALEVLGGVEAAGRAGAAPDAAPGDAGARPAGGHQGEQGRGLDDLARRPRASSASARCGRPRTSCSRSPRRRWYSSSS